MDDTDFGFIISLYGTVALTLLTFLTIFAFTDLIEAIAIAALLVWIFITVSVVGGSI